MLRTLQGWFSNAGDSLALIWREPFSLVVVGVGVVLVAVRFARADDRPVGEVGASLALIAWLVAALAITIYPVSTELEGFSLHRFEVQSVVPFAGTVEAIANSGDRLMSPAEYEAERQRIATDFDMPLADVNLDRYSHGPGLGVVLKDPVGNIVLFLPLGFLLPLASPQARRWVFVLVVGASVSLLIELSQLLFGLGSLGTVDDVIFNTTGAVIGFALYVLARRGVDRVVTVKRQRLARATA